MRSLLDALFHRALDRRADHLARRLAPHLEPGATVLDIGSGTGHNARAIRRLTGSGCAEVDVVDFHVVGPGPVLVDGARLPFPNGTFDVCLMAFVLNYAQDPAALLRDVGRVASRRVLLLQSTGATPATRLAHRLRNWWYGRFAFGACRRLGLIPDVRLPRQPRYLADRGHLARSCTEAGLIVRRIEPEPGLMGISRDLIVMERLDTAPLAPLDGARPAG